MAVCAALLAPGQIIAQNTAPASTSLAPPERFQSLDSNKDQQLSLDEFLSWTSKSPDSRRRDFQVCDFDRNGSLSFDEFSALSYVAPREQRGPIPDPVIALVDQKTAEWSSLWEEWDSDKSGGLSEAEFRQAALARSVVGLEGTRYSDWKNGAAELQPENAKRVLDLAWGVTRSDGERLRLPRGAVADQRTFRSLDKNGDGHIEKVDFLASVMAKASKDPPGWFTTLDQDHDDKLSFREWSVPPESWSDSLSSFLRLDVNLNGLIERTELETAPLSAGQKLMVPYMFPGFDQDQDGALSLLEFRLLPLNNLVALWTSAKDANNDGELSLGEFRFDTPPALAALSAFYFERLDQNKNGSLDLEEWTFTVDPGKGPRQVVFKQRDADRDGHLSRQEVLGPLVTPKPGDRVDVKLETKRVRMEEAFRRADRDDDGKLTLSEFSTDDGVEAIAPGARSASRKIAATAGTTAFSDSDEATWTTYLILGTNATFLFLLAIYLLKSKR